jgi:quinol monooxygenase YgiN
MPVTERISYCPDGQVTPTIARAKARPRHRRTRCVDHRPARDFVGKARMPNTRKRFPCAPFARATCYEFVASLRRTAAAAAAQRHQRGNAMHAASLILAAATLAAAPALAQTPPAPLPDVAPQYVVTYIEVAPKSADAAAALTRAYRDASRKEGAGQFDVYQRLNAPHHFAIVEQWKDTAAFMAHAEAAHTKRFRDGLAAHRIAPYDERRHHTLSAGAPADASDGLVAVTHVDIIPTERDAGIASVKALAEQSRGTPGNLRYDALTQSNRPNHMTLVEVWRDQDAYQAHLVAAHMKAFRDSLLPRSGSLYDERLYKALE